METGVLIGRFQPFHLGHLAAVSYALDQVNTLYIVVGSAQRSHEPDNPFTSGERIRMIKASLDDAGVDCHRWLALPVPDAEAHSVWVSYVDSVVPEYDKVFSNDPLTKQLFVEKGVAVVEVPLQKREAYSATEVRRRILKGQGWEELVPQPVAKLILRFKGVERIKVLSEPSSARL